MGCRVQCWFPGCSHSTHYRSVFAVALGFAKLEWLEMKFSGPVSAWSEITLRSFSQNAEICSQE